jgi:hypothetical protein
MRVSLADPHHRVEPTPEDSFMSVFPVPETTRTNRITLSPAERSELRALCLQTREILRGRCSAEARTECLAILERARILELAHEGLRDCQIARRRDRHQEQVRRVVARYRRHGLASLRTGPGRPVDHQGRIEMLATIDLIREQHEPAGPDGYARLLGCYLSSPPGPATARRYLRAAGIRFRGGV